MRQDRLINISERTDVGEWRMFVGLVNRSADEAESDHRRDILDKARVRRTAAGRSFRTPAGLRLDRFRDKGDEVLVPRQEGVAGTNGGKLLMQPRRLRDFIEPCAQESLQRLAGPGRIEAYIEPRRRPRRNDV